MGNVGKLSITVYPDTRKFRANLKKAVERVEGQVKAQIEVIPVISRQSIADVSRDLKERLTDVNVKVKPTLNKEAVAKARETLDGIQAQAKVQTDVDKASLKKAKSKVDGIEGKATVNADLDKGKAMAGLALLTRPRFVQVNVRLGKASLAAAKAALMALSGGNVISSMGRGLRSLATNLDTIATSAATMGPALVNLGSVALTAVSGVAALGTTMAAAAPAALALPGVLAAAGVGAGVLIAALKDTGTVLADLKPAFAGLQDSISASFWAQAAAPIRSLATSAMPMLQDSLSSVADGFGQMGAAIAGAVTSYLPGFQATFTALSDAVHTSVSGVTDFADGLMSLGEVGAGFLPQMAEWGSSVAASFKQWASNGLADGSIAASIHSAWEAMKSLGDLVVQVGQLIGNVFSAIAASGPGSLSPALEALRHINAALSGGPGRDALVQVFVAAREATAALMPGIQSVISTLVQISPVLGDILRTAGQIGAITLDGLAQGFQALAASGGVTDFFNGVLQAVQALAPVMPSLGAAFGAVASVAGSLMAALGPLVAQLIGALAPIVVQLAGYLTPIISMLQAALMPVISALAPVISTLVSALMPVITQVLAALLPALVPIVQTLAGALVPAIQLIATLIQALMPIITTVISVVSNVVSAVMTVLQGLLNYITGVLTGNWRQAWEGVKQIVVGVFSAIGSVIAGALQLIGSVIMSALNLIKGYWSGAWNGVKSLLSNAWNGMKNIVSNGVSGVVGLVRQLPGQAKAALGNLGGMLVASGRSLIQGFANGIKSAFGAVKNVVSSGLSAVRALFPFSPAKEGPFSGRGWVLYSGLSIGQAMGEGIRRSTGEAEAAAARLAAVTSNPLQVAGQVSFAKSRGLDLGMNTASPGESLAAALSGMVLELSAGGRRFEAYLSEVADARIVQSRNNNMRRLA